jgi:hypothetical protein
MDSHASNAIHALVFLDAMFPADDEAHKDLKPILAACIEACKKLKEESRAEEAKAFENATVSEVPFSALKGIAGNAITAEMENTVEVVEEDLSPTKKTQLLKEATDARAILVRSLEDLDAHLAVLRKEESKED